MNPYRHPTPRPYPVEIRYIPANAVVGALKGILAGLLGVDFERGTATRARGRSRPGCRFCGSESGPGRATTLAAAEDLRHV